MVENKEDMFKEAFKEYVTTVVQEVLKDELVKFLAQYQKFKPQPVNQIEKQLYTFSEFTQATGIGKRAIQYRRRKGTLQVVYAGGKPFIHATELQRFTKELKPYWNQ